MDMTRDQAYALFSELVDDGLTGWLKAARYAQQGELYYSVEVEPDALKDREALKSLAEIVERHGCEVRIDGNGWAEITYVGS